MSQMAMGKGVDVTITQVPVKTVDFADALFSAINGEYGKTYAAIVKSAADENMAYFVKAICFVKPDAGSNPIGGTVRMNASGTNITGTYVATTYDAKATIGDVYTVYSA